MCGRAHTLALTNDKEVWSWGFNSFSSVGRTSDANFPRKLSINPQKSHVYFPISGNFIVK